MKKIMIGVPTYNRKQILAASAGSLNEIEDLNQAELRIYDDCSTDFGREYLQTLFPTAKKITINAKNLGADLNTMNMYKDFQASNCDYFFNADSDLVFNRDVIVRICSLIERLEKAGKVVAFSVFNTANHGVVADFDEEFSIKKDVGAAGSVLSKEAVNLFLKDGFNGERLEVDYFWCEKLTTAGHSIFCTKKSYVQHIGLVGQNSLFAPDWGSNFDVDSLANASAIIKILENTYLTGNLKYQDILFKYALEGKFQFRIILKMIYFYFKGRFSRLLNKFRKKKG